MQVKYNPVISELKILVLFLFMIQSYSVLGQIEIEKSDKIEVIDNQQFYVHKIKKGQTVYSISKVYDVSESTIYEFNPGTEFGIKKGDFLYIPVKKKFIQHIVQRKETLYGISKKYNVSIAEIMKKNPVLENGLKTGQIIEIPVSQYHKGKISRDTIKIFSKDSLDRLKQVDSISIKKEKYCKNPEKKSVYHIALLLPLHTEKSKQIPISIDTEEENKNSNYSSLYFIQFYESALLAIEKLESMGLRAKFYIFDVGNDTLEINSILREPGFDQMDLIIGPVYPKSLIHLAEKLKNKDVKIVSPLSINSEVLIQRPNVFQVVPSRITQIKDIMKYIDSVYSGSNIVIVHNNSAKEKRIIATIDTILSDTSLFEQQVSYEEFVFHNENMNLIRNILKEDQSNVIIGLFQTEGLVSSFLTKMSVFSKDKDVVVFGLPDWLYYEGLNPNYLHDLQVHMFTSTFIDYSNENIQDFVKSFTERYKTDPKKENFAFQGYDIVHYFLSALYQYGVHFDYCIDQIRVRNLSKDFNFKRTEGNGWENNGITIFKVKDYQLIDVEKLRTKEDLIKDFQD